MDGPRAKSSPQPCFCRAHKLRMGFMVLNGWGTNKQTKKVKIILHNMQILTKGTFSYLSKLTKLCNRVKTNVNYRPYIV